MEKSEINNKNLEIYNKVREVPENAKKSIEGGRLKGMTDINPMWRIKTLTEQFGVCGIGWKPEIVRTWLENGASNEVIANVEIRLYVKVDGEWSEGIPGIGGSKFVTKETSGFYNDDEHYKKAYTDALSVACKSLGIGADVYFAKDSSKYDSSLDENKPSGKKQHQEKAFKKKSKFAEVNDIIKDSSLVMEDISEWIIKKFGKPIRINDLTDEQFEVLTSKLKKQVEAEMCDE